jgi:hypothetical protein
MSVITFLNIFHKLIWRILGNLNLGNVWKTEKLNSVERKIPRNGKNPRKNFRGKKCTKNQPPVMSFVTYMTPGPIQVKTPDWSVINVPTFPYISGLSVGRLGNISLFTSVPTLYCNGRKQPLPLELKPPFNMLPKLCSTFWFKWLCRCLNW